MKLQPLLAPLLVCCASKASLLAQQAVLEKVDLTNEPQRTVLAGQPFRAPLFGGIREQGQRNRRDVAAWNVGLVSSPKLDDSDTMPLASIYLWQHPDDSTLFRALLSGVANELFYASQLNPSGAEWVATLDTFTLPSQSGEWLDGVIDDREKLAWGYVRPGVGFGWRDQIGPQQDNMLAADLIGEAGMLYFGRGDDTANTFATPNSTLELRLHGKLRLDLLDRNIIELPHKGFAAGADAIFGHRANWADWGDPAIARQDGQRTRNFTSLLAYAYGITGIPGIDNEHHRCIAALHIGIADGVDRFSAPRVGGGPDTRGAEFDLSQRPVLPGAALSEYFPENYVLAYAGYRFEPVFYAFVDAGITFGQLDRDHLTTTGRERTTDSVTALSLRLSTGCFGNTRVQLQTAYGLDTIRAGETGAYSIVLELSGFF
jgi:hypothetical protein